MDFSIFLHMENYHPNTCPNRMLDELTELVQIAEQGGLTTAWIGEHHAMQFTISPNPLSLLTHLASQTKTIRLGAGTFVAPFWHPIRLASEAALVDIISKGRLEIGIARGAYQAEFDRMMQGMPASDGGQYLREMVPVLQKLWSGDYAHEGKLFRFPVSTSTPRPLQKPYPPMWIAARDIDSHRFAIQSGCHVMVTPLQKGTEEVESLAHKFHEAVTLQQPNHTPQLMLLQHTFVGANEKAIETGLQGLQNWYAMFMAWVKNTQTPEAGFINPLPTDSLGESFSRASLRKNLVIGQPDEVINRIKHYEKVGVTQYSYWSDNSLPFADKKQSLQHFINEVMPAFQ